MNQSRHSHHTALVIYGESAVEVAEILIALTQTLDYDLMEKHFTLGLSHAGITDFTSRGTTNVTAPDGTILLSASMNALPGHREDQVF